MELQEKLGAMEEIRALKARYCRYIDTKQWDRLRALFSERARFEGFGSAPDGADADVFVHGVAMRLKDAVSIHHCHTPDIVFFGPTRARAVWAMQDHLEWPQPIQLKEAPEARGFLGFGHYEEEYVLEADAWKMNFLRLTRLRLDPLPIGASFPNVARLRPASPTWLDPA